MSQAVVTSVLAGSSVLAVLALVRVVVDRRSVTWDLTASYVYVMGWLYLLPQALSAVFNARTVTTDVYLDPVVAVAAWVAHAQTAVNYLLAVVPMVFLASSLLRGRSSPNGLVLGAVSLASIAAVSSVLAHGPLMTNPALTLVAAMVGALFLPRGRGAAEGAAWFGLTFSVVCGLLTLLHYATVTVPCTASYKCGPLGVFVLGVLQSENAFGLLITAALPFVWLSFAGRPRVVLVSYMALLAILSSSRTSAYGAIAVLVVLVVLRPAWGFRPSKRTQSFATLLLASVAIFGMVLPFATSDPYAYTNRGLVWSIARAQLSGHYVIGLGSPYWSHLVQSGLLPAYASYSTHNQWLDVLWVAGGFGAVIFTAIIVGILRSNAAIAVAVLAPMVCLGTAERIWAIASFDTWSFAYIAVLLTLPVRPRAHPESIEGGGQRSDHPPHGEEHSGQVVGGAGGRPGRSNVPIGSGRRYHTEGVT